MIFISYNSKSVKESGIDRPLLNIIRVFMGRSGIYLARPSMKLTASQFAPEKRPQPKGETHLNQPTPVFQVWRLQVSGRVLVDRDVSSALVMILKWSLYNYEWMFIGSR